MNAFARPGVVLAVGATSVVAVVYAVKAVSRFDRAADGNSRLSFVDREIAGGNGIVVDQQAAYEARGLIPVGSVYRVVTGTAVKGATPLTLTSVEPWFRYFLMPRRPEPRARWVICYGCDVARLGAPYTLEWHDENGISIGRLG